MTTAKELAIIQLFEEILGLYELEVTNQIEEFYTTEKGTEIKKKTLEEDLKFFRERLQSIFRIWLEATQ